MQGIYINGRRPTSKKALKEAVATDLDSIDVEATSLFGNEYGGPLSRALPGRIDFVGPDPHRDRRFYGSITIVGQPGDNTRKVTVK